MKYFIFNPISLHCFLQKDSFSTYLAFSATKLLSVCAAYLSFISRSSYEKHSCFCRLVVARETRAVFCEIALFFLTPDRNNLLFLSINFIAFGEVR